MKNRFDGLDALRGIAAFIVVFYHYTNRFDELYGHENYLKIVGFGKGYIGVDLFFIISGFVIFLTIKPNLSIFQFSYKRFLRLYPAYWIALLITSVVVYWCGLPGREVGWKDVIVNTTMLQGLLGYPHVDGAYWSLQIEIAFYALCGFYIILRRLVSQFVFTLLWIGAVFFINVLSNFEINNNFTFIFSKLIIPKYALFFQFGIICYLFFSNLVSSRLFFITVLFMAVSNFIFLDFSRILEILCVGILFYCVIKSEDRISWSAIFVYMGVISYPLYLVHQNLGYVIIRYGYYLDYPNVGFISAFAISILISHIIAFKGEFFIRNLLLRNVGHSR